MHRNTISGIAAVLFTLTAATPALAGLNYNASKSNTGNVTDSQSTCPAGQIMNADKKCVPAPAGDPMKAVNYNSSKSNSVNATKSNGTSASGGSGKTDSINYNASKSNTGNKTIKPTTSGQTGNSQ